MYVFGLHFPKRVHSFRCIVKESCDNPLKGLEPAERRLES